MVLITISMATSLLSSFAASSNAFIFEITSLSKSLTILLDGAEDVVVGAADAPPVVPECP